MKPRHNHPKNPIRAMKKAARDEFGFGPTRISKNQKKYSRSREKRSWMRDMECLPARA